VSIVAYRKAARHGLTKSCGPRKRRSKSQASVEVARAPPERPKTPSMSTHPAPSHNDGFVDGGIMTPACPHAARHVPYVLQQLLLSPLH